MSSVSSSYLKLFLLGLLLKNIKKNCKNHCKECAGEFWGKFSQWLDFLSIFFSGPYKHRFIDVDYSSHVVMIACGGDGGDVPAPEIAMIWSRAETLPSTVLDRLKDEAGSYVGRDQVIDVDHSNC